MCCKWRSVWEHDLLAYVFSRSRVPQQSFKLGFMCDSCHASAPTWTVEDMQDLIDFRFYWYQGCLCQLLFRSHERLVCMILRCSGNQCPFAVALNSVPEDCTLNNREPASQVVIHLSLSSHKLGWYLSARHYVIRSCGRLSYGVFFSLFEMNEWF